MDMLSEKPNYLSTTTKIGFKLPVVWCAVSLLVGIALNEISGAIFVSLASLAMVWVCFKIATFFLSFQQNTGILSNNTYDNVIKLIWVVSLLGWFASLVKAFVFSGSSSPYYESVFSIVYFSFMLAATEKWGAHFVEKRV